MYAVKNGTQHTAFDPFSMHIVWWPQHTPNTHITHSAPLNTLTFTQSVPMASVAAAPPPPTSPSCALRVAIPSKTPPRPDTPLCRVGTPIAGLVDNLEVWVPSLLTTAFPSLRQFVNGETNLKSVPTPRAAKYERADLALCGPIGAGKTTFLDVVEEFDRVLVAAMGENGTPLRFNVQREPVKAFAGVLAEFYNSTPKQMLENNHVLRFQAHVVAYQRASHRKATEWVEALRSTGFTGTAVCLFERCEFDATAVFMELAIRNGCARRTDGALLRALTATEWVPDGLLYLRASAETCVAREVVRARKAEKEMSAAYVKQVVDRYEEVFAAAVHTEAAQPQALVKPEAVRAAGAGAGVGAGTGAGAGAESKTPAATTPTVEVPPAYEDAWVREYSPGHWAERARVVVLDNDSHWDQHSCYVALHKIMQLLRVRVMPPPAMNTHVVSGTILSAPITRHDPPSAEALQ